MDFLDPKKKRAHEIRLFVGYFLIGILLAISTTILVFQASGYDVDRKTGAVIQNGLLFLDSHPESATIYLNGVQKSQTDARFVLPSGKYDVELRRDGYRTWKQQVVLGGSVIERLVYPFLFPENLQTKTLKSYPGAASLFTASPDRRWLMVQQPGSLTLFDIFDLSNRNNPSQTITLDADLLTAGEGAHVLELVEWSTDNRHVLIKHGFPGGTEFIVIDRESPAQSLNVNKVLTADYTSVRLQDKKFDKLYVYNAEGGVLQTADLKTRAVAPFLTDVLAYQPHGDDMLLYVTREGMPAEKVMVRIRENLTSYDLRELTVSQAYLLEMARFDGDWYMAAGSVNDGRVYVYKNPLDDLKRAPVKKPVATALLRAEGSQFLSFSANARFIALQGGDNFAVYDIENKRSYRYDIDLSLALPQKANWMDGHRLTVNSIDKMIVFDFNGTNRQTLVDINPLSVIPAFDRDYNALFTPLTKNNVTAVQRTEMRLQPL